MRTFWTIIMMALALSLCPPSRAGESPEIRVVPARVILGALEFGRNNDPTVRFKLMVEGLPIGSNLTHIDCSQAAGVSIVSQQKNGDTIVVDLEADKQRLSAGQPFGAFIKKQIRLETDCPKQPQFVVPIIAWLDINYSSRDFSQFVFRGKPRWQGPWSTPNVAGAVLVAVALALIGIAGGVQARWHTTKPGIFTLGLVVATAGTTCVLWLLCSTYSREAWLAFFLACGAMVVCSAELRRPVFAALGVFLVFLCCVPSGVQRFESYANLEGDLSIANRLKLWTGALQMMADNPLIGVGTNGFAFIFERDYQQFSHTAQTSTAVNDYLTLGAEHGIYFLSILLGPLLLLLTRSLYLSRKTGRLSLMVFAAILLGMLTTSCFSTLWAIPDYRWLGGITLGGLVWYTVVVELRSREFKSFTFQILLQISKWTLATSIILFCISTLSLTVLSTRFSGREIADNDSLLFRYDQIAPRWTSPKGTVIYLADLSNEAVLCHSTLRPMAAMGWRVIPVSSSTDPAWVHQLIEAINREASTGDIFVAGETKGGKLAWKIAAEESPGVVKAGGGFDFLSADMDAPKGKSAPSQPFLVYQSLYSDGASSDPAICARNQVAFKDLPLTIVLTDATANRFSAAWIAFLTTLSNFFDHECRHR